jgi:hypothetical protein
MIDLRMIEVFDHINDTVKEVSYHSTKVLIHPHGHPVVLEDYHREGFWIHGVIFHTDGSSEVFFKRERRRARG